MRCLAAHITSSPYTSDVRVRGLSLTHRGCHLEYEKTTKDGLFTLTLKFNAPETPSYSPEAIDELCAILRQTATSLEFGLSDPSGHAGLPKGLPS